MADNVQPDAGEQREESSSGLLLSVDPLQGANNYKVAGGDADTGDKGGLLGDDGSDADGSDGALGGDDSDADTSDLLGGDDDGTDASDADGTDAGGSDGSDADGSDAGGIAADSDSTDAQMNPLGIGDTNVDGASTDSDGTDAK